MIPKTKPTTQKTIKRGWHHIDVNNKTLGRVSTQIALLLMGKAKPYFVRNLDCGDYVVVTNAAKVVVTGKKEEQKTYSRHSGYPGGFKSETLKQKRITNPQSIITHAVGGMLPDNRLKSRMLKRLYVYPGSDHEYQNKFV
jgi:large subunit ribosomal protein L13